VGAVRIQIHVVQLDCLQLCSVKAMSVDDHLVSSFVALSPDSMSGKDPMASGNNRHFPTMDKALVE
jgi:hypothetical protein